MHATFVEVDFLEEIRLRRWARENYKPLCERDLSWHPVVLNEMQVRDTEVQADSEESDLVLVGDPN